MSQQIGTRSLSPSSQMIKESTATSNSKRSSSGTLSSDSADLSERTSKVAKRSIGQDVVSSDPSNTQSQFPLSSQANEENREPRVISSMEVASNSKRSSSVTLNPDSADPIERTSKVAKQSIGQDVTSNDPSNTQSQSSVSKLSHSSLMQPGSASLSVLADAGSKSGPLNTVLTYLNQLEIGNLRMISKQFRAVIQSTDMSFVFKQQLEDKKFITHDDLFKHKKISGENLSSSKIKALDINDLDFTVLNNPNYSAYSPDDFFSIPKRLKNLEQIIFRDGYVENEHLIQFTRSCENLMRLFIVNLEEITDEAIITILQYHSNLNTLEIKNCLRLTNHSLPGALTQNASRLQNLSLSNFYQINDEAVIAIAQKCPQLQSLTIADCVDEDEDEEAIEEAEGRITDQAFIQIAQNCPQLKSLSFDKSCMVTENALIELAEQCPDLRTFEARTFAVSLTENSLTQIAKKFTESLVITLELPPAGFDYLSLVGLAQYVFSLKTLNIEQFELPDDEELEEEEEQRHEEIEIHRSRSGLLIDLRLFEDSNIINDQILGELLRNCAGLENLTLKKCADLTDQSFIAIAAHCKKLRKLELKTCPGITGQGLAALTQNYPDLEDFTLDNCSTLADEHLTQIAAHCKKLRKFELIKCPGIVAQGLAALTQNHSHLRTLSVKQVKATTHSIDIVIYRSDSKLDMSTSDRLQITDSLLELARNSPDLENLILDNCSALTDEHLAQIAAHCKKLRKFELRKCPGITGQGLLEVARNSPDLENLILESCSTLTDEHLAQIAAHCTKLRKFELRKFPRITGQGLAALAQNHSHLRTLSVNQIKSSLTSQNNILINRSDSQLVISTPDRLEIIDSLLELARKSPDLENLILENCSTLTDEHLAQIATHCTKLQKIDLKLCPVITGQGLAALTQNDSHLRTLCVKQFNLNQNEMVINRSDSQLEMSTSDHLEITDSLLELARKSPNLKLLKLENCLTLSDGHLTQIAAHCKKLLYVELKTCPGITGQSLAALTQNDSHLRTLCVKQFKPTYFKQNEILINRSDSQLEMSTSDRLEISDSLLELARNCPDLETLTFEGCPTLTDAHLTQIAAHCTKLQMVKLKTCPGITGQGLVALTQNRSQLRTLTVVQFKPMATSNDIVISQNGSKFSVGISDHLQITDFLLELARNCPDLETLTFESCPTLTDVHLAQIFTHCAKVKSIVLNRCPGIKGQGLVGLTQNRSDLRTLSVKQYQLTTIPYDIVISKQGSEFSMGISDQLQITDSLLELARNCPDLETLRFEDCPTLIDEHLAQIAAHCKKLRHVELKTCQAIKGQGLIRLARNCPNLTILTLENCSTLTDEHLAQITADSISLQRVGLKACPRITAQGLAALTQNRSDLRSLSVKQFKPMPNSFDIGIFKKDSQFKMNISNHLQIVDSLPELARNCPDLEMLTLENCPTLTDEHLSQITAASKSLQRVELKACPRITGQGLAGLTQNRPDLQTLSVKQFKPTTSSNDITISTNGSQLSMSVSGHLNLNITDSLIGKNCPSLEILYLISLNQLTNQLLIDLACTYPNLKKLDISLSQDGVQPGTIAENLEKGLVNLAKICSQLQSVKIVGCPQMDSETHQKIRQAYPNLTIELIP